MTSPEKTSRSVSARNVGKRKLKASPRGKAFGDDFGRLLDAAPDAMLVVSSDGLIALANHATERLFGYLPDELIGAPIEMLVPERVAHKHPQFRDGFFNDARARPMGAGLDLFGRRKDGSEFPAEISLAPTQYSGGTVVTAAIRDVTDRKRADAMFRGLLESAPDAIVIVGPDGRIVLVNAQTEKLFGQTRATLIGNEIEALIPQRYHAGHTGHRTGFFRDPNFRAMGSGLALFGRRSDGTEFPVEISLSPLETDRGLLVSAAIRDVSERRRSEEWRHRLAAIIDSSDDAIIGTTLDGTVTSWNQGAERLFGFTADEMIGELVTVLAPPTQEVETMRMLADVRRGASVQHFESVRRRKDGTEIDVSITLSPVRDAHGVVFGASKIARNITDRKLAEREVLNAKESAEAASRELEAFSYSVAHDLRAPLRSINGFSHALIEDFGGTLGDDAKSYLNRISDSAQQMGHLIDSLLDLARINRSDLSRRRVDLSALVRHAAATLQSSEPDRPVQLIIEDGLFAEGDARLLDVMIDNLLHNAWKFTAGKAEPRIEFGADRSDAGQIFFIRDNGAGFDMDHATQLFKPFQRLHRADEFEGTGIGLATVQRIVQRHGGRIWGHGEPAVGATFYFKLAAAEPSK